MHALVSGLSESDALPVGPERHRAVQDFAQVSQHVISQRDIRQFPGIVQPCAVRLACRVFFWLSLLGLRRVRPVCTPTQCAALQGCNTAGNQILAH